MIKKGDERNTLFARMAWPVDSEAYRDYYQRNPHLKEIDDELRSMPDICGEGTATYDPINSPIAEATFMFLNDIRHCAEGGPMGDAVAVEGDVMSRRIKGLAKLYGALSCRIIPMQNQFYYSHRGRHVENYGEEITESLPYAIVFTIPMDKELIHRGPQIAEVIETSHGYVTGAIIGMILSYYIRRLGYEARNHMDANYLLGAKWVAEAAGIGVMGRHGMIITPTEYGSCVRLGVVTTSIPVQVDEVQPSCGIEEFCKICDRCARACPGRALAPAAITDPDEWYFKGEECYRIWRRVGTDCGACISICPFTNGLKVADVDAVADDPVALQELLRKFEEEKGAARPYISEPPAWLK